MARQVTKREIVITTGGAKKAEPVPVPPDKADSSSPSQSHKAATNAPAPPAPRINATKVETDWYQNGHLIYGLACMVLTLATNVIAYHVKNVSMVIVATASVYALVKLIDESKWKRLWKMFGN